MSKIQLVTENLLEELKNFFEGAESIYILTSFVMESGVKVLEPYLKQVAEDHVEIKVCAGDYLYVTQPNALKALVSIHNNIEVQLWRSKGRSFHPKAYMFQKGEHDGVLVIGSSNLSSSALVNGVEWNLLMEESASFDTFNEALTAFEQIYSHEDTLPVNQKTIEIYEKEYNEFHQSHPHFLKQLTESEEAELMLPTQYTPQEKEHLFVKEKENHDGYSSVQPRQAQTEALEALQNTIEEGYNKAMVVMATGLGKTYLAAFFAKQFHRVLFVAHREEILQQAMISFKRVLPDKTQGLYNGVSKESAADHVFASISTLGMKRHIKRFSPDDFDLIIIDEFHHAAAKSYQKVIDYFQPDFLMGITATPDRMDGKDVYALCDGNVAYQLHFIEAINKGWLAPFSYYGIYDETDYSTITWLGTRYDEEELLSVQLKEDFADKILQAWMEHKQTKTLGFCSSIKQANFLENYFTEKGYKALSLHSKTTKMTRPEAIDKLEKQELDIIFTVNLFNEGVDIPSVDTLLFVRPTESLTVFTQQVGRGLRLAQGKETCKIIDLIGNYRNADIKLELFDTRADKEKRGKHHVQPVVPDGCDINFDLHAINLIEELKRKQQPRKNKLYHAYLQVKGEFGSRPTYLELHLHGNAETNDYRQEFKSYIGFLDWANELTSEEAEIYQNHKLWLTEVEWTLMKKSYKMVVLLYMLNNGLEHWLDPVTPEEVAPFFHTYLTEKDFRKRIDFSDKSSRRLWDYNEEKVAKLIAEMPMTKWSGSSKGLVEFMNNTFKFNLNVKGSENSTIYQWTKEICEYRLHEHFERKAKQNN